MSGNTRTSCTVSRAGVSRRELLAATALLGPGAALTAGAATAEPAAAAVVLGEKAPAGPLGVTATVAGRHRNLFRSFNLTSSTGVGVITVGTVPYLVTTNTGDGPDTLQIFRADTGALHYKASTPASAAGNFVHDGKGNLYFSCVTGPMTVSVPGRTVRQLGPHPAGVTGLYDFVLDHRGRLWAGTYPAGVAVCLDPATGREIARTPRLGTGNDYVRSLSVSPDGRTLWAGTGTADPDLFRIDVDAPARPVRVGIPGRGRNAFVLRNAARGRKVFVWHDDAAGTEVVSVHDVVTGAWSPAPASISGRSISRTDPDGWAYVNAKGTLMRIRPGDERLTAQPVATVPDKHTMHTGVAGSTVYVVAPGPAALWATPVSVTGAVRPRVDYAVVLTTLDTQSMVVDPATNTAYAGGYRGDGLCATNLATGEFAHSAASSGVAQIEGMIVDGAKLYVGSYGSAVIVAHDLARGIRDGAAYRRLARLGESHLQSRPFAWAVAQDHVAFGTVPEYGHRGGALGTIHRATGNVTVYNRLIPELSIVGLAASGHTLYGTTSCRAGYGIDDHAGDAVAFAADARTGRVLWRRALPGTDELYGPVLLGDRLYAATLDTVVELRISDGAPLRTFVLGSRSGRPGWQNAALALLPDTSRLVHLAGGTVTVLEPSTGRSSTVFTGAHRHLSFDRSGAMWVTVGNDVVKLALGTAAAASHSPPRSSPFRDVAVSHVFYPQITWLAARGISEGWRERDGSRTFRPGAAVSREVMAAFLHRMAGSPAFSPPRSSPFRDVAVSHVFYPQITWLAARGISEGWRERDGSRTFRPGAAVSREVMAAFLHRMAAAGL